MKTTHAGRHEIEDALLVAAARYGPLVLAALMLLGLIVASRR